MAHSNDRLSAYERKKETNDQYEKLLLELRRGIVVLAVLSQLKSAKYGYSLIQELNDQGLPIEEGTLYPLLRRLEKQGLLKSDWKITEPRPRKYYQISQASNKLLDKMTKEWFKTVHVMDEILNTQKEK